jgi:hypothetical protein
LNNPEEGTITMMDDVSNQTSLHFNDEDDENDLAASRDLYDPNSKLDHVSEDGAGEFSILFLLEVIRCALRFVFVSIFMYNVVCVYFQQGAIAAIISYYSSCRRFVQSRKIERQSHRLCHQGHLHGSKELNYDCCYNNCRE